MMPRILYLEDRQEAADQIRAALEREYLPVDLVRIQGRTALETTLRGGWSYDLVFLGEPLAGISTLEALDAVRARRPDLPVVVLPALPDESRWTDWLRRGATDCVPRTALPRLAAVVRRALRESADQAALRMAEGDRTRLVSLLRTVLESTSEGILVADLAGRITTYNRKFMALCGIPEYVMAPMELDQVLRFLQDQFLDPEAFLREARLLGEGPEHRQVGLVDLRDRRTLQARSRVQQVGGEAVGRVFSFAEAPAVRDDPPAPSPAAADLLEAVRTGRAVPWHLTEDGLAISDKGHEVLGLPPDGLPRDLPALEERIHPEDRDLFRQALEQPQAGPFPLRLRRGDGDWIQTRWTLKRAAGGYRGIFAQAPAEAAWTAPDR